MKHFKGTAWSAKDLDLTNLRKGLVYALCLAVVFGAVFLPGHFKLKKLREDNQEYQKRMRLLEEHNAQLEEELAKMQEDPEYLERKAREKLGIVKKGEIIYQKKQDEY
ncbi:septum formation initiator family protein [Candidatus Omnitrophota bacterium]